MKRKESPCLQAGEYVNFEEFLNQYGDNPRYELADGELIDMEPTGHHEAVGGKLATKISVELERQNLPWLIPRTCIVSPFADGATARRPEVIIVDETVLSNEPLWSREPVITLGRSIKLVVEVVSTNWETDYARKVEEYALLGIPEYWIVDYRGLGGTVFIGKPKQPTVTVCEFIDEEYAQQLFRLGQPIISPLLKSWQIRLDDILPR